MTKLYYIYGGIRYSSALYKGEARGRWFCATQSTTLHLTNQVDGINRLGNLLISPFAVSIKDVSDSFIFLRFHTIVVDCIPRWCHNGGVFIL